MELSQSKALSIDGATIAAVRGPGQPVQMAGSSGCSPVEHLVPVKTAMVVGCSGEDSGLATGMLRVDWGGPYWWQHIISINIQSSWPGFEQPPGSMQCF